MAATRKKAVTKKKPVAKRSGVKSARAKRTIKTATKAKPAKAKTKPASKKRGTSVTSRAAAVVPAKVKRAALKVLTEAAVGAARALIPPLQEVIAASESGAKRKSSRGKDAGSED